MVILRGAPNGSERNKIERSMSMLHLSLVYIAVKREKFPEWTEHELKNCSTIETVREVRKKVDERHSKAQASVERLEEHYHSVVATELGG